MRQQLIKISRFFCLLPLLLNAELLPAAEGGTVQAEPLRIVRVTPSGNDVPAERQLVFQFNRPVVPLGRMERDASEIPVTITPALNCQWRWLNTSALACQLDEQNELRKATRYHLLMQPGIQAEDGGMLAKAYEHHFVTERAVLRYAWFSEWRSPGTPVIRLTFNQSVSRQSVAALMQFVQRVDGKDLAKQALNVDPDPQDRDNPRYIAVPGEGYVLDFGPRTEANASSPSDDDLRHVDGDEARRVWLVSPQQELVLDSSYDLRIRPGLVSALGPEPGVEQRTVVNFDTFPEFEFLGLSCVRNDEKRILITAENSSEEGKCNPLYGTSLAFSTPVLNSQVKQFVQITPDLAGGRKDYDPWANQEDYSSLNGSYRKGARYEVWLPERLKAAQEYRIISGQQAPGMLDRLKSWFFDTPLPQLQDEFGRPLKNPIDLSFFTDHRLPNFELVNDTAVLESGVDSEVPLYVTNLQRVEVDYKALSPTGERNDQQHSLPGSNGVEDIQFAIPLGVRDMLGQSSGAVYGQVNTEPGVDKYPTERTLFALVTPYQLHVKIGHFNTLVWVTDLATGLPVADAKVQIYQDTISQLSADFKPLAEASSDAAGLASLPGTLVLDPQSELFQGCWGVERDHCARLFVRVDKDDTMALLPLEYRFEANLYRASNYTVWASNQKQYGHFHTWGTTAQGLYRAGDTMQFKLYVRDQNNRHYVPAPRQGYRLEIYDPAGKKVHEIKDITLSEFGSFSAEYAIPENAAVGWYRFHLSASFTKDYNWTPLSVLVSDFTPSPFKVTNQLNGDLFHPGESVLINSAAKLHSGGAYPEAEIRTTVSLKAAHFSSSDPQAQGFIFDSYREKLNKDVFQKSEHLDAAGTSEQSFTMPQEDIVYGRLRVESAVRDERGKYVATSSQADYLAVDRLVGLRHSRWVYPVGEEAVLDYLVVDPRGTPVAGSAVEIRIERLHTKSSRVKGAGNAYLTHFIDEWLPSGSCAGVSAKEAMSCRFTPDMPGTYKIIASVKDSQERIHRTELQAWMVGAGRVLWHEPNDDSLQIIPEKPEYAIGETARYLIKNPYPGAQALISIERYGVLKSWVQSLEGSTPVIEFPVEPDFMPGFYLSVVVVSPRVQAPPPERGEVDLGKPAFKMGYLQVPVNDPYKQLKIDVSTDAEIYKPRDTVKAKIHVEPRHGSSDEAMEIAVAVLDESVLDLVQGGTKHFDPYQGFNRLDPLDLRNFTLLSQLVGRQKFEKKGANPGGDGGADLSVRSIFKYVSYWNPSIIADAQGNAEIEFSLPDNLTGWRVLAFAVTPTDRMGLGHHSFKVNRPTELRPVMPNQVTEGDQFQAGFTVLNRTAQARDITIRIQAEGDVRDDGPDAGQTLMSQTLRVDAYQRQTVFMPVRAAALPQTRDLSRGQIRFIASAGDARDRDGLEHTVPVNKRRSLDTAASYGSTDGAAVTESILVPAAAYPDVGAIAVVLSPSVIGNIDGAIRYMRDYPYNNWEQRLSKGVMAAHYQSLKAYFGDDLQWPESAGLAQQLSQQAANYQAPNGGMSYFIPADQYVSPYLSAYTALVFNWLRERNYEVPTSVENKLHNYLQNLLRKDAVPSFYSQGMTSTIRAVALAALAPHGKLTLADLQRYQPHVAAMSLFGQAHFLQAALSVEGSEAIRQEAADRILAHAVQSAGKFSFNEELDDSYSRILATPLRSNCAILSSMARYAESAEGAALVGDVPLKLVRSITQTRGNRDHWENTQENVFCLNALVDYAQRYEQVQPQLQVNVQLNGAALGNGGFRDLRDPAITYSHAITRADLGAKQSLAIQREGAGRLYYAAQVSYAPTADHAQRINAGIDVRKEVSVQRNGSWVLLTEPGQIQRGELVRVDLFLSLPTARNFVVVDDPVPGGLEPVNRDLATTSSVDAEAGAYQAAGGSWWFQFSDWHHFNVSRWSFYHQELRHDAVRFYSDYLPAGNYHLSYTAQAIAVGEFSQLPVLATEMYDPDIYGKGLPGVLQVQEK